MGVLLLSLTEPMIMYVELREVVCVQTGCCCLLLEDLAKIARFLSGGRMNNSLDLGRKAIQLWIHPGETLGWVVVY